LHSNNDTISQQSFFQGLWENIKTGGKHYYMQYVVLSMQY